MPVDAGTRQAIVTAGIRRVVAVVDDAVAAIGPEEVEGSDACREVEALLAGMAGGEVDFYGLAGLREARAGAPGAAWTFSAGGEATRSVRDAPERGPRATG